MANRIETGLQIKGLSGDTNALQVTGNSFINGDINITGNVNVIGTATTLNTQIVQTRDNRILLNFSGTSLTAIGGGIEVLSAKTDGTNSQFITDSSGDWNTNVNLNVSGKTKTTTFQLTTSPVNGYVLTSDASGNASWQPLSSGTTFTGNTSASCINDLYVSNIHSCSPLNINPLNEGNVYFGSTSGVTIDVPNSRLGIGVKTPQYPIEIVGSNSKLYYDINSAGGSLIISGSTNLPRFSIVNPPYLTKPGGGGSIGMRTWDDTSFPGYGKVGDMHIYAGNDTNGLNIINRQGTFMEDYIRFYAGQDANGTIPDIHIQGSGTTRGFVGIGTATPVAKLDVNGKTRTTTFQLTTSPVNGYVLTSDASGNGTWQASSTGTTPTLQKVLTQGNTTSGNNIIVSTGDKIYGDDLVLSGGTSLLNITEDGNNNKSQIYQTALSLQNYVYDDSTLQNVASIQLDNISSDGSISLFGLGQTTNLNQDSLLLDPLNGSYLKSQSTVGADFSEITFNPSQLKLEVSDGTNTNSINITSTNLNISNIPYYDDDTDAGSNGLISGDLYQTTGNGLNPLDVAGILMIKQ